MTMFVDSVVPVTEITEATVCAWQCDLCGKKGFAPRKNGRVPPGWGVVHAHCFCRKCSVCLIIVGALYCGGHGE